MTQAIQPGPDQRHYFALAEVYLIEMCNQEEWLALNKDFAPKYEVRAKKKQITKTMQLLNTALELSNQ